MKPNGRGLPLPQEQHHLQAQKAMFYLSLLTTFVFMTIICNKNYISLILINVKIN
jgi:hypothetical protein